MRNYLSTRFYIIITAISNALSGCMLSATINLPDDHPTIKSGSVLTLNQSLRIGADTAMLYFQDGQPASYFSLDQYRPYCRLEMFGQTDTLRILEPGDFTVIKVNTIIEDVRLKPAKLASMSINIIPESREEIYATVLYLRSAIQPGVELLSCQRWEDASGFPRHLNIRQIRNTLGEIFTLTIVTPK